MADNPRVVTASGTIAIAANDISSVFYQRWKLTHGGAGTAIDTSSAAPLPVTVTAGTTTVTGGVAVTGSVAVTGGTVVVSSLPTIALGASSSNIGDVDVLTLPSLPAGTNNIGDVDVLSLPALPAGNNNIGDVDIASALPAGTNAIGKLAANSGVDIGDVDVTSISAGTNAIGNVGLIGRTSGGLSTFRSIDLDETEEDVKTSAGQVFGYYFANLHATSWRYVKLYNATAASTTVGSTTPVRTLPLPPNSAGHVSIPQGLAFSTAICAAATTGVADSDTGAPGTNEVVINIDYV